MMDLHLTPYFTFKGDLVFGDADGDQMPLVRISFYQNCATLTPKGKIELFKQLAEHLAMEQPHLVTES